MLLVLDPQTTLAHYQQRPISKPIRLHLIAVGHHVRVPARLATREYQGTTGNLDPLRPCPILSPPPTTRPLVDSCEPCHSLLFCSSSSISFQQVVLQERAVVVHKAEATGRIRTGGSQHLARLGCRSGPERLISFLMRRRIQHACFRNATIFPQDKGRRANGKGSTGPNRTAARQKVPCRFKVAAASATVAHRLQTSVEARSTARDRRCWRYRLAEPAQRTCALSDEESRSPKSESYESRLPMRSSFLFERRASTSFDTHLNRRARVFSGSQERAIRRGSCRRAAWIIARWVKKKTCSTKQGALAKEMPGSSRESFFRRARRGRNG